MLQPLTNATHIWCISTHHHRMCRHAHEAALLILVNCCTPTLRTQQPQVSLGHIDACLGCGAVGCILKRHLVFCECNDTSTIVEATEGALIIVIGVLGGAVALACTTEVIPLGTSAILELKGGAVDKVKNVCVRERRESERGEMCLLCGCTLLQRLTSPPPHIPQ